MRNKFIGLILVRSQSSRLPGKCFFNFGKVNILEHMILRCRYFKIEPIICTTNKKKDNKIIAISKKYNLKFFRGSEKNKIKRINDCCKKFKINQFHLIDSDDPFFCGLEVKRSLKILNEKKLDIVKPSIVSNNGSGIVGYSITSETINILSKKIKYNTDTEMISNFFKLKQNLKISTLDNKNKYSNVRLTLDYIEDYTLLLILRLKLGNLASRKEIDNFIKINKYLRKINIHKNLDWKKNQFK
tara:strand:+ start:332 stop:1060 length:729 start_codon:yes stop_codon:yes gene_type:complete